MVIAVDGLRWQEVFGGSKSNRLLPFVKEMGKTKGGMMGNRYKHSRMNMANGIWSKLMEV